MRSIPESLRDHLAGEATTLCRCWLLRRRDGFALGFTDHDRRLAFGGVTYEPSAAVQASDIEEAADLSVDSSQIEGVLTSDSISDADIEAGYYDGAAVELYLVNWRDPEQRMLERSFRLGQIRREGRAFSAELRGASAALDQTRGRRFSRLCDADLGDARCGFALAGPPFVTPGLVVAVEDGGLRLSIACPPPAHRDLFRNGRLRFDAGAGAGRLVVIAEHERRGGNELLTLWQKAAFAISDGEAVTLFAGCDKRFATCRDRFANQVSFRGFPHIPGNDFALGYVGTFDIMDGGALIP